MQGDARIENEPFSARQRRTLDLPLNSALRLARIRFFRLRQECEWYSERPEQNTHRTPETRVRAAATCNGVAYHHTEYRN